MTEAHEKTSEAAAAATGPVGVVGEIPPNNTVYVNNLNERVKVEDLKKGLMTAFSQYGTILDIVAMKTRRTRGQAFVVYRDISAATQAVRNLQNRPLFDKPMRVQFAKDKSDAIAKLDGSYPERYKRRRELRERQRLEEQERKRKERKCTIISAATVAKGKNAGAPTAVAAATVNAAATTTATATTQPYQQGAFGGAGGPMDAGALNNILFIENLPGECDEKILRLMFEKFPGFKEAKLVPTRQGLAFVEFQNEVLATVALNSLQGIKVGDTPIRISYAKK